MPLTVAFLICSFNRRDTTVASLDALLRWDSPFEISIVLVDDGSTDGTPDAIAEFDDPRITIVRTDGDLFWAASMSLAETHARHIDPDVYVWLNDDIRLDLGVLAELIETAGSAGAQIGVGTIVEIGTTRRLYGGLIRNPGRNPLSFSRVDVSTSPQRIDTFEGSVVAVSREAATALGHIDGHFSHAYADGDYGLRAGKLGIPVILHSGVVGECAANPIRSQIYRREVPLSIRWRAAMNRRGIPLRSQARFFRRHAGISWPVWYAFSYLRVLVPRPTPANQAPLNEPGAR